MSETALLCEWDSKSITAERAYIYFIKMLYVQITYFTILSINFIIYKSYSYY